MFPQMNKQANKRFKLRQLILVIGGILTIRTPLVEAYTGTIDASAQGWYNNNGLHTPSSTNYIAGTSGIINYRNFAIFAIPSATTGRIVTEATVIAYSPQSAANPSGERWNLHQVTTPANSVRTSTNSPAIFSDLGDGVFYGSSAIINNGYVGDVSVTLNGDGITALQNKIGSDFVIGGTVGAVDSSNVEHLFASSGSNALKIRLNITTADPVASFSNVPNGISFQNVHVGTAVTTSDTLTNTGLNGTTLLGSVSKTSMIAGNSSETLSPISLSANQSQSDSITTTIAQSGYYKNSLNYSLTNNSTLTLSGMTYDLGTQGYAYNYAQAELTENRITVDARRVGDTEASKNLTLSNHAPNDGYSEKLDATFIGSTSGITKSGSVNLLAAGSSDNNRLNVGVSTATSGNITGSATLGLTSNGTGTSNLGNTALASQTVNVSGNVYQAAQATVSPNPVNFGIVHVGDNVNQNISVQNTASGALTDSLKGVIISDSTAFNTTGDLGINGLAANNSANFNVQLDTSAAGQFSGNANLNFVSHNSEMADLTLAGQQVSLSAQVNNYATATFASTFAGFTNNGNNTFTLDFGSLTHGTTGSLMDFSILNTASGFADWLRGSFSTTGTGFDFVGVNSFNHIFAGQSQSGFSIGFDALNLAAGNYLSTLTFHGFGYNASGYDASIGDFTLNIMGTILAAPVVAVPEPETFTLVLITGLPIIAWSARRRKTA